MLTTVASRSTRQEKANSESRAPPIDTNAPMIGMPAAMKPPKTKNITMKVRGSAMPSPRTRSRSTWSVIAVMISLGAADACPARRRRGLEQRLSSAASAASRAARRGPARSRRR